MTQSGCVHLSSSLLNCTQGDEVEDGDVCTVHYVNEAMIEQQLETKIYQMSREEAKT